MKYPKYWNRVAYRDWYEDENKMWVCLSDKNAICEIDKTRKKVRILGNYPQKGAGKPELSAAVVGLYEKVVFVPLTADDIVVYDRASDQLIFIPIKKNDEKHHEIYQENMKFRRAFVYREYVFLLGYSYPAIIKLNIKTLEISYLTEWVDIIEPYIEKGDSLGYFKEGYSLYGTKIYLPLGCCGGLIRFELEKNQFEYIPINAGTSGFGGLTDVDGTFYLTGRSGKEHEIIIWNKDTELIRKIQIPVAYYYAPIVYNGNVFLFSFNGRSVIQLNEYTDSFREYELPESFSNMSNTFDIRVMAVKCFETVLKFQMGGNRKWYEIDLISNDISESIYYIEDEQFLVQSWINYCDIKVKLMRKEKVNIENLPVEEYLVRFVNMETGNYMTKKQLGTCGSCIWKYLKML